MGFQPALPLAASACRYIRAYSAPSLATTGTSGRQLTALAGGVLAWAGAAVVIATARVAVVVAVSSAAMARPALPDRRGLRTSVPLTLIPSPRSAPELRRLTLPPRVD